MYVWKCWRDTRWFFFVFLGIAALPMPLTALASRGGPAIVYAGSIAFQNAFVTIVAAVAYALATLCAIQEFTDKTEHFLFTKPRSRTYFVWVSWLVGLAELLGVAGVSLLVGWRVLAHYGVRVFTGPGPTASPRDFVEAIVYASFAYALTFALTVASRNGLKGLGASLGVMAGMVGVAVALRIRWKIDLPLPPQQIGHLPIAWSECVWIILALLLVCVAQVVVERAEI